MGQHAFLPPSSAYMWVYCSRAAHEIAKAQGTWSLESEEGTATHWAIESSMDAEAPLEVGMQAANGVVLTDEMIECAEVMVGYIEDLRQAEGDPGIIFVEFGVSMPYIHEHNWGTPDVVLWFPQSGNLHLIDYKHGHRPVAAYENWQLLDYMNGLKKALGVTGDHEQHVRCHLTIVQPRCYQKRGPIDTWSVKMSDLRGYWNRLRTAAHEACKPEPQTTATTGLHCRDCPARLTCTARRAANYNLIDYVNEPTDNAEIPLEFKALERQILADGLAVIKSQLEALEDEITASLQDGQPVPGLALETKPGSLYWTVKPEVATLMVKTLAGADISKPGVLTPTQTLKLLPTETHEALKQITKRKPTTLKLTKSNSTKAAQAFTRK